MGDTVLIVPWWVTWVELFFLLCWSFASAWVCRRLGLGRWMSAWCGGQVFAATGLLIGKWSLLTTAYIFVGWPVVLFVLYCIFYVVYHFKLKWCGPCGLCKIWDEKARREQDRVD